MEKSKLKKKQSPFRVPKPSTLLKQSLALLGPNGKYWVKDIAKIEPGEDADYPKGAFCSIGAIQEINTPNENKAAAYLAFAISIDRNIVEDSDGVDAESIIAESNDENRTTFKDVKRWFMKAIKLAKAVGE